VPTDDKAEEYLDSRIAAAVIEDQKASRSRSTTGRSGG
jgi:hypothetical protein